MGSGGKTQFGLALGAVTRGTGITVYLVPDVASLTIHDAMFVEVKLTTVLDVIANSLNLSYTVVHGKTLLVAKKS